MAKNHLDTVQLSLMDQIIVRGYIRNVLCFALDDQQRPQAILRLKQGLQTTLAERPFLSGSLQLTKNPEGQDGKVELYYNKDVLDVEETGHFHIRFLGDTQFPYAYDELHAAGMPPSKLPGEILSTLPNAPSLCKPAPILAVHANFIRGGLLLCIYMHHSVVDGGGLGHFITRFAQKVRSAETVSQEKPDESAARRLMTRNIAQRHIPELIPDVKLVSVVNASAHPPSPVAKHLATGRIFTFSVAKIQDLKKRLTARLAGSPQGAYRCGWISTMDCIAALVWVHVTRARWPHLNWHGHSRFGIAVNIRSKMDPPLPKDYSGNAAWYNFAKLQISRLVGEDGEGYMSTILLAATSIRAAVNAVDSSFIRARLELFASVKDVREVKLDLDFSCGPDMFFTSWADFGADADFGLPGARRSTPDWVRKPYSAEDGGIIVMPRRRRKTLNEVGEEAPYEVLVQLRRDDMERICREGELVDWAERVVE